MILTDVNSGLTISMQTIESSAVPMCVSSVSTPLPVHALITTTYTNGVQSSYYDYVVNDQSTRSSISTISSGIAVADPLYVAWEAADLSLFPVAYATSLAQKIGVTFTPTAKPGSGTSTNGPSQTGSQTDTASSNNSGGLSSGAKIGIGAGVGAGALLLIVFTIMAFVIRKLRRRNKAVSTYPNEAIPAMMGSDAGLVKNKWYQRTPPNEDIELHNAPGELDSFPISYVPGPPVELEGSHVQGRRY